MNWPRRFIAALRFLTIFPIPGAIDTDKDDLAASIPFFPVVGLLLGLIASVIALGVLRVLPQLPAAVLLVLVLLSFSGALHLDGLADTADGFFSSRSRERILEIMRDSRTGAMGVIALVMLLLLKVTCLSTLASGSVVKTVFLMVLAGRISILVMISLLPYARSSSGLGALFYGRSIKGHTVWGTLLFFFCLLLLSGIQGLVVGVLTLLIILIYCGFCYKKIGGATGDTLGAGCELAETAVALLFCLNI